MTFDFVEETKKLIQFYAPKYNIDEDAFDVYTSPNLDYFKTHPRERGDLGIVNERYVILLNRKLLLNIFDLRQTFTHEFRHLWQRFQGESHNIQYWTCWPKQHPEFVDDAYMFSPNEIDANRFSRSGCKLDDFTVFDLCRPHPRAFEELRENQRVAAQLAQNEGFHILSEGTAQRLIELSLLDSEAYYQWLGKHNRERLRLFSECKD